MDLKNSARLCRLCLCISRQFIDVMEENGDLGFVVAKTIEDLLQFKVRKVGNYPWLACSTCLEKLIDFKLFKSRCIDSNITFEKRFCQAAIEDQSENEGQEMPNDDETVEEEDGSDEEEAGVNKMCPALTEVKATTPDWHNYNQGKPNVIFYPCKTERLDSCEGNPEDQKEEIEIEEGQRLNIKEEPRDVPEDESAYPPEVPGISRVVSVPVDANVSFETCLNNLGQHELSGIDAVSRIKVDPGKESLEELEGEDYPVGEGFYCVFCSAVLSTEKNLRDHIAEHEEGRLRFRKAQQQLSKENTDEAHKLVYVNPLNALAKGCGGPSKGKTAISSLPFSLVSPHSGDESYKCTKCFKHFRSSPALKAHKSECTSKFKCNRCKKYFGSQNYLSIHLKVSKSKNSSCRDCSLFFGYRCELRAHRREAHTKVFVCKDCHCSFDRYYHLREHVLTHCKVKPLVCKDCQQTFIGSSALRKHRTEAHNGRSDQSDKQSSTTA